MKKFVSVILALSMALAMTACGGNAAPQETTAPAVPAGPATALEALETVWNDYAEDEKFSIIGGSMAAPVDGAPGAFDIADENITYNLLIPADQLVNVTEAASMIHMMNANTFTGAVYKLAEGVQAADFVSAMQDAIKNNQWMCGFPETLLTGEFGGYVVVAFGANDLITVFQNHVNSTMTGIVFLNTESLM